MVRKLFRIVVGIFALFGALCAANWEHDQIATREIRAGDNAISRLERAFEACNEMPRYSEAEEYLAGQCLHNAWVRHVDDKDYVLGICQTSQVGNFTYHGPNARSFRATVPRYYDVPFWYYFTNGCRRRLIIDDEASDGGPPGPPLSLYPDAAPEQPQRPEEHDGHRSAHHVEAGRDIHVRDAEEAVAEGVHHIEDGIE